MKYIASSQDVGTHYFRPFSTCVAVNNHIVCRTLAKNVLLWKSVGRGYTFDQWKHVGRWLMSVYHKDELHKLDQESDIFFPVVLMLLKTSHGYKWLPVKGEFLPSKTITRIIIVYQAVNTKTGFEEYNTNNILTCREFDMFSLIE